jgi:hypothetical protein
MTIRYIRKLFFNPQTANWESEISSSPGYSELPPISLKEIDVLDQFEALLNNSDSEDTDVINNELEALLATPRTTLRPLVGNEVHSYKDITQVIETLANRILESREYRNTFNSSANSAATQQGESLDPPHEYYNSGTNYGRLFDLGNSSFLPGLLPYRDTGLLFRSNTFDEADNMLKAGTKILQSFSDNYSNNFLPLQASILRLSPLRSESQAMMYPGDMFKLMLSGGNGAIITKPSGLQELGSNNNLFKVITTTAQNIAQQVSDGRSTINININVQLPPGYSASGENEET